jgi:hypothetical protein
MDAIADFRKVLEIDSLDQDAKESLRRLGSDGPSSGKQE